jgi:transcriptional regulator with XRE-family HTH domain
MEVAAMHFGERLAAIRKAQGMTQQQAAERVGVHVVQWRRYEAGKSQPTLDTLRNMAVVFHIPGDELLFDPDERAPQGDARLIMEAITDFSEEEMKTVKEVLHGLILTHQAKRWSRSA